MKGPIIFAMMAFTSVSISLPITPAHAQFSKFKSKTKFNNNETAQKSATDLLKNASDNKEAGSPGQNIFGRPSGSDSSDIKKDKTYVNLNPETAFGPEVVESFDFPNTSLIDLTKFMQKLVGINLILDKELKGKVSIMAPTAITVGDAWKAYLTALNLNGYTLVKSGAFYKIVSSRDIRYTPTKIYTGTYTPDTENYVMRILPLKNINSTELTRSFRPFMSRYGRIIDIKQTNTIIVQDTGSNINRLNRLIKFIDVPGHEETLQIIPVKNSSAQEIAALLDKILKGSTSGKFRSSSTKPTQAQAISKIIAEPRTNTIIAMANADGAKQLRDLIHKLDIQGMNTTGGQIHVYYLNHGDSETLSKTLSSLVTSAGTKSKSRFSKTTSAEPSLFNNQVKITSDKDNNALVVTASPTDYLTIKEVIKKLDVARDQVYVEGLMMETNVSNGNSGGVSIIGAYGSGSAQRAGFTKGEGDGLLNLLTGQITSLGGLFAGLGIGKKVTLDGPNGQSITVNSVNALVTAIASRSSTNVLATPQILALDNTEAVFEVAEQIPTLETSTTNSTATTSVKQQKVGLTLKITPQINKVTRFVKLKIDQKIEDFSGRALPDGVASQGLATVGRAVVTTVVVRDRDTIAMGGLMRDRESESVSKVPLLGDIPVLGWLFKNKSKTSDKVNLLFFLTPRILTTYQKANAEKVKDILNRRGAHLKKAFEGSDPFGNTIRGLYEKANKQEKGPLYDEEEAKRFQKENEEPGIGSKDDQVSVDVPNYKKIYQEVTQKKAALKKN